MNDVINAYPQYFAAPPEVRTRAPGRVNLLGEHVDYNDGIVLPAAIDRAVHLAASGRSDDLVTLHALDLGQKVSFRLAALDSRLDAAGQPLPGWARYPAGVAWALRRAGLPVSGMQAVYTSDVPIGAGLSSSAAVEVAFAATWRALDGWSATSMQLAQLSQQAENQYVGVHSGLMDQFASACGQAGQVLFFDTRSLEYHPVALPPETVLVLADSGVRRSLATSAYNERRADCEEAVRILQQHLPGVRALRDVSTVQFAAYSDLLPSLVRQRAEHVVREIHRVEQAVSAMQRQDWNSLGALLYAGHASLRDLYEVSCAELDLLVQLARRAPGALGARLTGAGFGGCTVNLVWENQAEAFIQHMHTEYQQKTGRDAAMYLCRATAGVSTERL